MQLDRPLAAITPTVDGDVLLVLARADAEFTPATVQRLPGAIRSTGYARHQPARRTGVVTRRGGRARSTPSTGITCSPVDHRDGGVRARAHQSDRGSRRRVGGRAGARRSLRVGGRRGDAYRQRYRPARRAIRAHRPDSDTWRSQVGGLERARHRVDGNDAAVLEFALARRGNARRTSVEGGDGPRHPDRRRLQHRSPRPSVVSRGSDEHESRTTQALHRDRTRRTPRQGRPVPARRRN